MNWKGVPVQVVSSGQDPNQVAGLMGSTWQLAVGSGRGERGRALPPHRGLAATPSPRRAPGALGPAVHVRTGEATFSPRLC